VRDLASQGSCPHGIKKSRFARTGFLGSGPALSNAVGELPLLRFAVNPFKAAGVVSLPVAVVDFVQRELGVEEVKPGKVHVDVEALEGPDVISVVVKTYSMGCLVMRGLHRRPVLLRARHSTSL
jgi:hypothetical protein